jgi:protein ImuB
MFATFYVPNFFLQAALRHQEIPSSTPVALIAEEEKKPTIIQLNQAAELSSVRNGMTPSQGLARCLTLVIKARSSIKEAALTNLLLQYCFSLSPSVEATAPGVWTVQFTRVDNLSEKVTAVVRRLGALEIDAHAGIAPTPDLSFLAANLARPILEISDPEKFLAPLPIDILAIPFQH